MRGRRRFIVTVDNRSWPHVFVLYRLIFMKKQGQRGAMKKLQMITVAVPQILSASDAMLSLARVQHSSGSWFAGRIAILAPSGLFDLSHDM